MTNAEKKLAQRRQVWEWLSEFCAGQHLNNDPDASSWCTLKECDAENCPAVDKFPIFVETAKQAIPAVEKGEIKHA